MEDAMDFMESRPLVGFQMDGSHLHDVLQNIIEEQQQQSKYQQLNAQRLTDIEDELHKIGARQKEFERALGNIGPDTLRKMRQKLDDVTEGLDNLVLDVKNTRQLGEEAAHVADDANSGVQNMRRELAPLRERQDQLQQEIDDVIAESAEQNRHLGDALKEIEHDHMQQTGHMQELIRELQNREGREEWKKLHGLIDELGERTDKNFRSVEDSARAVDAELARHRSELDCLQGDMGALDAKTRKGMASIAKDLDAKCEMILDMLRDHRRSSKEIEDHMVAAGQALAQWEEKQRNGASTGGRAYDQIGSARRNGW
ncbi:hypothetical protein DQ04_16471010 [Trypanosoma grayi]|uniref:hypothetical protein n=1 Tax=Trypanosoma grayi TaxID=71804 RepID=UPI0004F40E1D|nr:hypothetical protein DQ04_16471010 [Trypanosoma grayi]KEG06021.1 hypothetical protein DQ04_16471010 [Trypanosoma grayi]